MNLRESMKHLYKTFRNDHSEDFKETQATLLQLKNETASRTDKIIMKECITTLIELKQKCQQNIQTEKQFHQTIAARNAVATLSYSECKILLHILDELKENKEAILIASQIADKANITRSVTVNTLRKLQSGKIIEAKSLGSKGTFVKIINLAIYKEAERLKIIHRWKN